MEIKFKWEKSLFGSVDVKNLNLIKIFLLIKQLFNVKKYTLNLHTDVKQIWIIFK